MVAITISAFEKNMEIYDMIYSINLCPENTCVILVEVIPLLWGRRVKMVKIQGINHVTGQGFFPSIAGAIIRLLPHWKKSLKSCSYPQKIEFI
jgi:hypothetical protein